jgi:hypothetical protein
MTQRIKWIVIKTTERAVVYKPAIIDSEPAKHSEIRVASGT